MENGLANLAREEYFGLDINENNIGPTNLYHIETCTLKTITIYKDRAELTREVKPQLKVGKISMIVFKKMSSSVDKDSFRIDVSGPGVIRDVYYRSVVIPDDEKSASARRNDLQAEVASCTRRLSLLTSKQARLRTQKSVIDGFSETLVEKRDEEFKGRTSMFDPRHMETLASFLHLYEDQVEKLDLDLLKTQDELDSVQRQLEESHHELEQLQTSNNEKLSRELTVMLECKESEPVILEVTYILSSCQWTPSYDIRVYSNDGNMKILYYGQIQQNTGEEWAPEAMYLSTAMPGVGERAPDLGSQSIRFKDVRRRPPKVSRSKRMTKALSFYSSKDDSRQQPHKFDEGIAGQQQLCFSDDNMPVLTEMLLRSPTHDFASPQHQLYQSNGDREEVLLRTPMALGSRSTTGQSTQNSTGSANIAVVHFTVPRPPVIGQPLPETIPDSINMNQSTTSDIIALLLQHQQPHRALVGVIDLHPTFEYVSVPRRTPYAFLKANCHNGSSYAMLPGCANVFIDNNFIGKTMLGSVAPQEEFQCNLGVDSGISINYKPIFKYRDLSNSSGSSSKSVVFKQLIEIKNQHERNIRLLVKDQLPVSGEDKIKIHLQEPQVSTGHRQTGKPARLTKSNVVEWNLEMHPNELKELTLKYTVEYPMNEEIDVAFLKLEL